jgi:DNA-binding NtrC family response regulator
VKENKMKQQFIPNVEVIKHDPIKGHSPEIPADSKIDFNKVLEDFNHIKRDLINQYLILNITNKSLPLKTFLNHVEKELLEKALSLFKNNQKLTSRILGVKEPTLCEKIKKHKIKKERTGIDLFQFRDLDDFESIGT